MNYIKNDEFSCDYALTVTLKPKQLFKMDANKQLACTKDLLVNRLEEIGIYCKSIVVELTKAYNIHYHGVFCVKKNVIKNLHIVEMGKYVCDKFRNNPLFGFIDVKQCTDVKKWIEYMMKDIKRTYKLMHVYPLVDDNPEWYHLSKLVPLLVLDGEPVHSDIILSETSQKSLYCRPEGPATGMIVP